MGFNESGKEYHAHYPKRGDVVDETEIYGVKAISQFQANIFINFVNRPRMINGVEINKSSFLVLAKIAISQFRVEQVR